MKYHTVLVLYICVCWIMRLWALYVFGYPLLDLQARDRWWDPWLNDFWDIEKGWDELSSSPYLVMPSKRWGSIETLLYNKVHEYDQDNDHVDNGDGIMVMMIMMMW